MALNKDLFAMLKYLFTNPFFIAFLLIKLVLGIIFASDVPVDWFIPFLEYFSQNPANNPYFYFYNLGIFKIFPYPPMMLFIMGLPFLIFSSINAIGISMLDLLLLRLPLLLADIAILMILVMLNPAKKKESLILYWCSPIVMYILYLHGQLDIIPIALLLVSLYLLFNDHKLGSAIFLGLSLASKTSMLLVAPLYFFYLWKKDTGLLKTAGYFITAIACFIVLSLPYMSLEFLRLVFGAQEQGRVFNLIVPFSAGLEFYVVIAAYVYVMFKAFSFRTITKNIMFMLSGVTFTIFVTLVRPAQGWYVWAIPFIVYFFANQKRKLHILYWGFNGLYLLYFILIPEADLFRLFQFIAPAIAAIPAPYELLTNAGVITPVLLSTVFTLLSANLLYIAYLMYKYGVKSSLLFQQSGGIPVIGIAGDSGTGKTTAATEISEMFGNNNVNLVCGDDIHRWARGDANWEKHTHLNPRSNRIHLHYGQISTLKQGEEIQRSEYDHGTGKFTEPKLIKPKNYIIDEGLHTLMLHKKSIYDLSVYMEPDPDLKLYWKIQRDVKKRGYTKAQVLEFLRKRKADSKKYISPQRAAADVIVTLKPSRSIKATVREEKKLQYQLQLTIRANLDVEPLLDQLMEKSKLKVSFEYPNNKFQQITLKGEVSRKEIINIIKHLKLDYTEYGVQQEGVKPGIEGLTQLFILYCLDQRLLQKYEAYERA
ncbi:hypothetical protein ACFL1B_05340 [Nanoarchaeota archaeon]